MEGAQSVVVVRADTSNLVYYSCVRPQPTMTPTHTLSCPHP